MAELSFLAVDAGRNEVKFTDGQARWLDATTEKRVDAAQFPARIGSPREVRLGERRNYSAVINGIPYFVGDLAKESRDARENLSDDKCNRDTKTYILTSLGLLMPKAPFVLSVGLPIDKFTAHEKMRMKGLLVGDYNIRVQGVGETNIALTEENVLPVAEGVGAFWDLALDAHGRFARNDLPNYDSLLVIDMGRRTVNYVTVEEGQFRDVLSGTLNYGAAELEVMGASSANCKALADRVYADLTRYLTNLNSYQHIILTGGGMLKVGNYLSDWFRSVETVTDPVFANVRGMRKMGMLYAEKQAEAQKRR